MKTAFSIPFILQKHEGEGREALFVSTVLSCSTGSAETAENDAERRLRVTRIPAATTTLLID